MWAYEMRRKRRKKIMTICLWVVMFFCVVIAVKNIAFKKGSISNEMTLAELQELDLRVAYVETSEDWTEEIYEIYCDDQIAGSKDCSCILVGVPTGNIYFNRGTILQEVYVEQVIEGKCSYETIWLQNGLKSTLECEKDTVIIKGMDRSFMQEDCKYLLFCDASAANEYSDKKVYTEADGMWFGCYNLTRDSDVVMEKDQNAYNSQIEFYTSSKKTMKCYNQAKQKLIEMYYNAE